MVGSLTTLIKNQIVKDVHQYVKLVLIALTTVLNVLKTDLPSQLVTNVHSLKDIMKSQVKLIAHHVTQDVKPVVSIIHVKPVKSVLTDKKLLEKVINFVHVWMDTSKEIWNVSNVLTHV